MVEIDLGRSTPAVDVRDLGAVFASLRSDHRMFGSRPRSDRRKVRCRWCSGHVQ